MMMLNIILAVCFVPIWPVIYFLTRNLIKPKKNIILGVTLPESVHRHPGVEAECRSFQRWHNIVMLPVLPLIVPPFLMSSFGPAMTWHMTWLMWLVVAPFAVFAVYRGRLMSLKREKGWRSEVAGVGMADVKAAAIPPKRVNGIWFLLPVSASFVPAAASLPAGDDWAVWLVYVMFAAMCALFWWIYTLIFRLRAETVNENLPLTMALTRARRYQWSKFWVAATWLTAALNITVWLFEENVTAFMAATLAFVLLLMTVAIKTEFSARTAQQKLTAGNMGEAYQDEDDYWLLGLFYHNPNDTHFLVNDRIGMNMSVNLAKPGAKLLMALALLCIVAMPFIGVWIWVEESVPTALVLTETELVARHTRSQYVIPLGEIETVELIEELPNAHRVAGTGMDNLLKGRFNVQGYKRALLCLQPKDPPFLVIRADGEIYIFNDANSEVTRTVFASLGSLARR
jgi:uncharacterized membrane protein